MRLLIGILCMVMVVSVSAENQSPVGLWKTIDDKTGSPKALIRIVESAGELQGSIEKIIRLMDENKDSCLYQIAYKVSDIHICDQMSTPLGKDTCRLKVAKQSDDAAKCNFIKISTVKDICDEYFEENSN